MPTTRRRRTISCIPRRRSDPGGSLPSHRHDDGRTGAALARNHASHANRCLFRARRQSGQRHRCRDSQPGVRDRSSGLSALGSWDGELGIDSIGGTIYNVFFELWHNRVMRERFPEERMSFAIDSGNGLSAALLHENLGGWFADDDARLSAIRETFSHAIDKISDQFGADVSGWEWGKLHTLGGVHPAAQTPLQRHFFNLPFEPHQGGTSTVRNGGYGLGAPFITKSGANYRFVADLGTGARARDRVARISGEPGSPHYADQVRIPGRRDLRSAIW
ncbi:MAG: penicillin acylase family protein [Thermomicrobiales bacterium]